MKTVSLGLLVWAGLLCAPPARADGPSPNALLEQVDARLRSSGDFKARVFLDEAQRDKRITREVVVHRRPAEDKFVLLVTQPKTEAGGGYLRLDQNLFQYDPRLGKWERRTERDQLAGTNARRRDFDEANYARDYEAVDEGIHMLGRLKVRKLQLTAREGVDVPFPRMTLWVDEEHNVRKTQEYALSGKLMRTSLIPHYGKVTSPEGGVVWYPREVRIYDEVEKGRTTVMLFKAVDARRLEDSTFTKAWLEGKSR